MRIVVTGGRGFIGSHFVEKAISLDHEVIDIDKMTYCANKTLPWDNYENYTHIEEDISEIGYLPSCEILVNFAAESHVDNSINETMPFMKSNIMGVHNLLELARGKREYDRPIFFQISTDEVYGDLKNGKFSEKDRLKPSNPYAASKAAAEMLVLSYNRTYGLNYIISRSTNNYGARQYHEKLIPRIIDSVKQKKKIPIHGDGSYVRDWIYVKDNVDALFHIIDTKLKNDIVNIGADCQMTNLEVVKTILEWHNIDEDMIVFVENRWGQDLRYALNCKKIRNSGWSPKHEKLYKWFK
jgi:dTDP-glucose 4,6-dehydratase